MAQTATAMQIKKTIYIDAPESLGEKIKHARKCDPRPLTVICREADISTNYWNQIENEKLPAIPEETLRKIEKILNRDFGVDFDDALWDATKNK